MEIQNYIKMLKAIGDPARLRLLKLLSEKELCVSEIEEAMKIKQTTVSQQLRRLKEANLVIERKKGWWSYYSLNRFTVDEFMDSFKGFLTADIQSDVGDGAVEKDENAPVDKREMVVRKKEFID